ncbi:MAG: hypothetical protein IPH07_24450 [Deltaproteobacteria bacterium]|nr:hypothetical protein [Deltaproteobacteria bacterium]
MTSRVTVKCPPCGWAGQRLEASATTTPCPRCGATVEIGLPQRGRPPLPPDQRRVLLRLWVLPATLEWCEGLTVTPAEYLDAAAQRATPAPDD